MERKRGLRDIIFVAVLLLASIFFFEKIKDDIYAITHLSYHLKGNFDLPLLTWQHVTMSFWSCLLSIIIGMALGIFCLTGLGDDFRPIIEKIVAACQALPTIGLLAILLPILGFGLLPGIIVLVICGTMPIVFSTIAGIENIPEQMIEIGIGLGMTKAEIFLKIKLPLAFPVILSGVRTASIIIIGSATLTAITGAGGLGLPIFRAGFRGFDPIMLLEGAIPVTLLAMLVDRVFAYCEIRFTTRFEVQ
jgi:osmoprotectant transport system permease protein